jgi:hypothetical protein
MEDNYPEMHELENIKNWPHEDPEGLMDYCISMWMWGSEESIKRPNGVYRFATGGWSGNESIIEALGENTLFWMMHWESSHRGGLHIFKIQKGDE